MYWYWCVARIKKRINEKQNQLYCGGTGLCSGLGSAVNLCNEREPYIRTVKTMVVVAFTLLARILERVFNHSFPACAL